MELPGPGTTPGGYSYGIDDLSGIVCSAPFLQPHQLHYVMVIESIIYFPSISRPKNTLIKASAIAPSGRTCKTQGKAANSPQAPPKTTLPKLH